MDFGEFNLEPLAVEDNEGDAVSQENDFGEFRSRCNTWPRHPLDQEPWRGQPRDTPEAQGLNGPGSEEDLPNVVHFGSTSGLSMFGPGSRFPNPAAMLSHSPKMNSAGSPGSGMNTILPLVSEEDFLDDLISNALSNEIESSLNMVIPDSGIDMDVASGIETSGMVISTTADDPSGFMTPTSPLGQSSKHKINQRRNPWGSKSYADLITQAIQSAPEQRLTLAQIYEWLSKNVQYFREKSDNVNSIGWKNSIRHNLSLHSKFVRLQSDGAGKSSWWTLDPECVKQSSQNQKPIRRRAQTLESASLQSIRPGRRSRGSSVNPGYRKRDGSGCSTPLHGRRPSTTQLDRAVSSQSLSYPDSPGLFAQSQLSPDYLHPGAPVFSGPIRTRTLSSGSSCAGSTSVVPISGSTTIGGRLSPFRPRASSAYSLDCYKCPSPTWKSVSPDTQGQPIQTMTVSASDKDADFNDAIQIITSDLNLMRVPNLNFRSPMDDRVIRNSSLEIGVMDPRDEPSRQHRTNLKTHSFYVNKYEDQIPSYKIKILEPRDRSLISDTFCSSNRPQYLSLHHQRLIDENELRLSTSLPNDPISNYGVFVNTEDTKAELPELLQEDLNFFLDSKPGIDQITRCYEERLTLDPSGQVSTNSSASSSGFCKLANNSSSNLLFLQS